MTSVVSDLHYCGVSQTSVSKVACSAENTTEKKVQNEVLKWTCIKCLKDKESNDYCVDPFSRKHIVFIKRDNIQLINPFYFCQKCCVLEKSRFDSFTKALLRIEDLQAPVKRRGSATSEIDSSDKLLRLVKRSKMDSHETRDDLPILQDPANSAISKLKESEKDVASIKEVDWEGFRHDVNFNCFVKEKIKSDIREWLRLNEDDRPTYTKKLHEYLVEGVALADVGPARGKSVFAKKDIEKYQVLGPYAGILHPSEESLKVAEVDFGFENIHTYLFGTRSDSRSIDAFRCGNILSLCNTGHLHGYQPWALNNARPIIFGENLVFIVASEKIMQGQEILLDYGPAYNPTKPK